jgi:hypothetical protein
MTSFTDDIEMSESVLRVIFFAKYEAHVEKRSVIGIADLLLGIRKETKNWESRLRNGQTRQPPAAIQDHCDSRSEMDKD